MNILLITTISGFLPTFLMQDVKMLQSLGFTVHYASNFSNPVYECDREALERDGIMCHHIPIAKSPFSVRENVTAFYQLLEMLHRYDIRFVHCHNPVGGLLGRLLTVGNRKLYVIYTAHGFHFYQGAPLINWLLFYPVERILARRTDQLITINQEDEDRAAIFCLKRQGSVSRIPGVGLDMERFCPDFLRRKKKRERLGVGDEEFIFLAVGELNRNKNHRTIITAFSLLEDSNAKLFICGEGAERRALETQIQSLGLAGRVTLWGYVTQIEEYYQCADCFLFPSLREGLGMAALESMSCGLPLIVSDNRGTREYAFDNALVCGAKDVEAFAKAMRTIMADKERAGEMGRRSREIAMGFSREKSMEVMKRIYTKMREACCEERE